MDGAASRKGEDNMGDSEEGIVDGSVTVRETPKKKKCGRCGKEGHNIRNCQEELAPLGPEERKEFLKKRRKLIAKIMASKGKEDEIVTFDEFEREEEEDTDDGS